MKTFITVLVVIIIALAGWYWLSSKEVVEQNIIEGVATTTETISTEEATTTEGAREVAISAKNFEYSQKEIRVKKGDRVKINLTIAGGTHDWVIDEFTGARTKIINTGASDSIEFVADKTGTFEYYCSVGTHRQMGMVGKLIVE